MPIEPTVDTLLDKFMTPEQTDQKTHTDQQEAQKAHTIWEFRITNEPTATSNENKNPMSKRQISQLPSTHQQTLATGNPLLEKTFTSSAPGSKQNNSAAADTGSSTSSELSTRDSFATPHPTNISHAGNQDTSVKAIAPPRIPIPQNTDLLPNAITASQNLSSLVEELLTTNQLDLSPEAIKILQEARDRLGIFLGIEHLPPSQQLAVKNGKMDQDARDQALCNCILSELKNFREAHNQTATPPKTLLRTFATAASAIMTMQYAQTAFKVGLFSPSYKMMAAFAVPSLITASANLIGEQKTDNAIQWVQDTAIALKDHVVRNRRFYAKATCLLTVSGAALYKYTERSINRKLGFEFSGRATQQEKAQSFAAEAAAVAAENLIESALSGFKPQVVDYTPQSKTAIDGLEGAIQGTILPSIAALVIRITEAVTPTLQLAVTIGSEVARQVMNKLKQVPAENITNALSNP